MNFKIGDRFYFYKNLTDSNLINVGYKGLIDEVLVRTQGVIYCDSGLGFCEGEIKPIIRCYAQIGETK